MVRSTAVHICPRGVLLESPWLIAVDVGSLWVPLCKPCSHIQSNTQNSNPILKITIYCTKYPHNVKIHSKRKTFFRKILNCQRFIWYLIWTPSFIICTFCNFLIFIFLYFLYSSIFWQMIIKFLYVYTYSNTCVVYWWTLIYVSKHLYVMRTYGDASMGGASSARHGLEFRIQMFASGCSHTGCSHSGCKHR